MTPEDRSWHKVRCVCGWFGNRHTRSLEKPCPRCKRATPRVEPPKWTQQNRPKTPRKRRPK